MWTRPDSNDPSPFRVAAVQMAPIQYDVSANCQLIRRWMQEARDAGAQLVVFPECALSGYVFHSDAEAWDASVSLHHPEVESLVETCTRMTLYAVVGLIERDETNERVYNSALIIGPEGRIACYRKSHLPVLGVDRFVSRGCDLPTVDLPFARIGPLICYDIRFPEAARSLTLRGIDALILPTNWPEGAESSPEFLTRARAWENRIYLVACNRVGVERGTRFIGRSQVIAPDGSFLAQADGESEMMLIADIDPAQARRKRLVISPGVFELDPVGGRRPDLYGDLMP